MFPSFWALIVSYLALAQVSIASSAFEKKCLAFTPEKYIKDATLNVLQHVPAGANLTFPDNDVTCGRTSQIVSVDLCRMTLEIKTSRISKIAFEAWFPEDWSGRFLATGNGGIDGCCSLGGRQGIKSAEKFPNDFDGIVAGAPGVDFNNLISWRARFFTITGPIKGSNFIPKTAWQTWIHDEVLRQCDTIDKVKDGIIEDPALCKFDPSTLLCGHNSTAECLNEDQVQQLKIIYSDYRFPDGQLIYPAMQPGSEINAVDKLYAGAPFAYSDDWFKYVVYNDPTWNASEYGLDDVRAAQDLNPGDIRTYPSSLPGFKQSGGKLLMYHGQQDNQITSFNTNRFYEHLRGNSSYENMDEWTRFFRVSGMFHCSTGPGAWVLGQGGNAAQAGIPFDAQRNVLAAMIDWVEGGSAPEYMEGTKFVNDTVKNGVDFMRRHCKYPARNTFLGGDHKKPESWGCMS
ncbi:tannase and feruloyl esterase [Alternaria alternata]|nr:tannase and feruloyl esterase [Alternaria alternata]